ncbi:MAG: P-loop NTPase fold protein [Chthoniobacter sp.]|nr:P-loop NTPase fold protein [Chthoniobacter sp.]
MFLNDNETATDLLYYEAISKCVVELITESGESPISIGIHGDWGAGKSSILAMLAQSLSSGEDVVCVRFNGWQFQGFEDAKTVIIEQILATLEKSQPVLTKAKKTLVSLMKRVKWLKVARKTGGLLLSLKTGLPINALADAVLGQVKDAVEDGLDVDEYLEKAKEKTVPSQIHAFHEEFEKLLKEAGIRRLVVLIDDLDRCLPETAIETLEAIKLFLFVPRTAFIVAADEAMIEYAVKRHFPDLPLGAGALTYSRNYLEKLIQVPFRIPAMGLAETKVYIALLTLEMTKGSASDEFLGLREIGREVLRKPWAGGVFDHERVKGRFHGKIPEVVDTAITLSNQVSAQLTEGTKGNPRQIKRFLNALMLRQAVAKARGIENEVTVPTLAKIMLAERFLPDLFDRIGQLVAEAADGKVSALREFEEGPEGAKENAKKGEFGEWLENESVRTWGMLEPKLSDADLRPYILITRDKRNLFGRVSGGKFETLLLKLLSGSRAVVIGAKAELQALRAEDANAIFEELRSRIKQKDDYSKIQPGAIGIAALVNVQVPLQESLLAFAEELPAERLGAWIIGEAAWGQCFKGANLQKWEEILRKWASGGSQEIQKTVKALLKAKK